MCGLIAHDKKKRFELLALKLDETSYQPALIRATSGHSIHWLEYNKMLYTLNEYDVQALLAMVHGTKFMSLAGILDGGLNAGREFCMFNMIPHYDARSERGQRYDDWNSLVFFDPARVGQGFPYFTETAPGGGNVSSMTRSPFASHRAVH